jgi:hypothetical protein
MQSWELYKSFHPLWCWVGLGLCESIVVFHPSRCEMSVWGSMLWFEQRLKWWRWLIPSWHVVLESVKDWILGVDTPGQHVPPHARYGTACSLIWNAIGCVSYSVEWGYTSFFVSYMWHTLWYAWSTWCKRGPLEILSTASGALCWGICSKAWHTLIVDLCNGM